MAIYYVRTTGNDTTGDGSTGNPWATIAKAASTVSLAGGHTVKIGTGTYAENNSGAGFLAFNRSFSDWVTFEAESGNPDHVIITGTSNAASNTVIVTGAAYIRLQNVTFANRVSSNISALRISDGTNIEVIGCKARIASDPVTVRHGILIEPGASVSDVTLDGVSAIPDGAVTNNVGIGGPASAFTVTRLAVTDCHVDAPAANHGLWLSGDMEDFSVSGGSYRAKVYGIIVGTDEVSAGFTLTGTVEDVSLETVTGHALLLGYGATDVVVSGVTSLGGDYGAVLKHCSGCQILESDLTGGTAGGSFGSAIYFKAATGCSVTGSRLVSLGGTTGVVRQTIGDSSAKSSGNVVTDNTVVGYDVPMLEWPASGDDGGSVVDRNVYDLHGIATFGQVQATTGITTLPALRAAWSGYGDGSNDANSFAIRGEVIGTGGITAVGAALHGRSLFNVMADGVLCAGRARSAELLIPNVTHGLMCKTPLGKRRVTWRRVQSQSGSTAYVAAITVCARKLYLTP